MMKRRRSRKLKHADGENLSDVAAWLYTDLLLGLAVVFIGGGAFLVQRKGEEPAKGATEIVQPLTYQLSCEEVLITVSRNTSTDQIAFEVETKLREHAELKQWSDIKTGLINVWGRDVELSQATAIAREFTKSHISQIPTLANSEIANYGKVTNSGLNNIDLEIYLVYKGQIKDNGCQNNE